MRNGYFIGSIYFVPTEYPIYRTDEYFIKDSNMDYVYMAEEATNSIDGYPHRIVGLFVNENDAKKATENNTDMGGGWLGRVTKLPIFSSLEAFKAKKVADTRERALAKLTREERKILNV
jgi:hypothetical protein